MTRSNLVRCALAVLAASLAVAACGGDDEGNGGTAGAGGGTAGTGGTGGTVDTYNPTVGSMCDKWEQCQLPFPGDTRDGCIAFYQKVRSDLEARCTDPEPVVSAYKLTLECFIGTFCNVITSTPNLTTVCPSQWSNYEQAQQTDGTACVADDD